MKNIFFKNRLKSFFYQSHWIAFGLTIPKWYNTWVLKIFLDIFPDGYDEIPTLHFALFSNLFWKNIWITLEQKISDQFLHFYPHIFCNISSVLVFKQVLDNIFWSIIVTYYFCMIPPSLIFSNMGHFGLKQNPTGLQETI